MKKRFLILLMMIPFIFTITSCKKDFKIKDYHTLTSKEEFVKVLDRLDEKVKNKDFIYTSKDEYERNYEIKVNDKVIETFHKEGSEEQYAKIDFDKELINCSNSLKVNSKTKGIKVNEESKTTGKTSFFYQKYNDKYYMINLLKDTIKEATSFKIELEMFYNALDIVESMIENEADAFYIDGNIYTAEKLDDDGEKSILQIEFKENKVKIVSTNKETSTSTSDNKTKITNEISYTIYEFILSDVSLKEKNIDKYFKKSI